MKKSNSTLKKIGKVLLAALLTIIVVLFGLFLVYDESVPQGENPKEADELAKRMLEAVHHEEYKNTRFIEWSFVGQHQYKWDKEQNLVEITWDNYEVQLNTRNNDASSVKKDGAELEGDARKEVIEQAVGFFNNDSFWLVAPHKVFDPGTERLLVPLENGEQGLLVRYTSGGSTPGDAYLWMFDEAGLPKSFKMWVSVIPIGGAEASWDNWTTTESGTLLPSSHKFFFLDMTLGDVKAY
jgi:hypothetical protein